MPKASRQTVDDLPQLWTLDVEATANVLQALWNYYATIGERALAHAENDPSQENMAYLASLAAWDQLFRTIDQYVSEELAGAWKVLLREG